MTSGICKRLCIYFMCHSCYTSQHNSFYGNHVGQNAHSCMVWNSTKVVLQKIPYSTILFKFIKEHYKKIRIFCLPACLPANLATIIVFFTIKVSGVKQMLSSLSSCYVYMVAICQWQIQEQCLGLKNVRKMQKN